MRIADVAVHACRLPPTSPWEDATNRVQGLEFIFVELTTDNGLKGSGITYTVDIGGTAIATLISDYLAPLVIGMDARNFEAIWTKLNRQARRLGLGVNSMAIAAIDIAVWDLIGKAKGEPLYRLLGGARETIPAYISEINLSASDTIVDLVRRIDDYKARGYRAVKIKIGHDDPDLDIARITAVKERLGNGTQLFVDLNQKWQPAEAIQKMARLDTFELGWVEEPLLYQDIEGHARLRRSMKTPLALGESLYSRQQFQAYLAADAVDIVQADIAFVGGVTEWLKVAHLANGYGRRVAPHYMMELSLSLLCGVSNGFMLEDVVGGGLYDLGLIHNRIVPVDGVATPPQTPGHGLEINWDTVKRHRLTGETVRTSFAGGSK